MRIFYIDGGATSTKIWEKTKNTNVLINTGGRFSLSSFESETLQNLKYILTNIIDDKNEYFEINIGFPGFINYDSNKLVSFLDKENILKKYIKYNFMTDIELQIMLLLPNEKDFLYIACGTGTVAIENSNFKNKIHGGWGHIIGDDGSSYDFAKEWIRLSLIEQEKNTKNNVYSKILCNYFNIDKPREILKIYSKQEKIKQIFSEFSLYILTKLDFDINVSKNINFIMKKISSNLFNFLETVINLKKYKKVYFYGGLFKNKSFYQNLYIKFNDYKYEVIEKIS